MAERRMFSKSIIDSDLFLDMPQSAQCLYFHLAMRADDEGFVDAPKKIQRMIGASEDDCRLLIAKKFLIPFETGVVVIRHWRIHNYIQKDRYVETKHKVERSMLWVDDNGSYILGSGPNCVLGHKPDKKALTQAQKKRLEAKRESSLPYSFEYKIRAAFVGRACPICGRIMSYGNNTIKPTIQHNIPISVGGKHEIDNISVICMSCNSRIQNKEITPPHNTVEVKKVWELISGICTGQIF